MTIDSKDLIQDLISRTTQNIQKTKQLSEYNEALLNWRPAEDKWSVLECIEHLNLYGDYYLPEIKKRMQASKRGSVEVFKSGFLGNYFAKSMLPKEKLNTMKTFKNMNPIHSVLTKSNLERFLEQQQHTLELLNIAACKNLNKVKVPVSISKWIKLNLGDTFRVLIYHNDRHMVQAFKTIALKKE